MTSSLHSRRIPAPAEHYPLVLEALTGVAEQSFFACVEPCDPDTFVERAAAVEDWLSARVAFTGAFAGHFRCTLPEALVLDLFEAFIGDTEPQRTEALVFDLMGELSNMACGTWLTRTAERRQFHLARPEVQRLPEPPVVSGQPGDAQPILLNDEPVAVHLSFVPCQD